MSEIVNLKQHRKRRERATREEKAAENRVRYGRSKDERKLAESLRAKATRELDGHKR